MRKFLFIVATILFLAVAARAADKVIVAYVPNWIDLAKFSETIDYKKITHINIAFENPTNDAGDLSFNRKNQPLIDAARKANVKILVSIGGGAAASNKTLKDRYELLTSKDKRAAFIEKIIAYLDAHNFDGIDVDIEGPSIGKDYGPFITDLAPVLKAKNKMLTAALSQGYGGDKVPKEALLLFDFVHIMAYDGTGPWAPNRPGQHSSLDYAKRNVKYWLDRGLPKERAVLGVPFYGYGFGKDAGKDEYKYREIIAKFPGSENTDQAGDTIFYNGIPTIKAKSKLAIDDNLAGIMIWSLDSDATGDKSLLAAIHATLTAKP